MRRRHNRAVKNVRLSAPSANAGTSARIASLAKIAKAEDSIRATHAAKIVAQTAAIAAGMSKVSRRAAHSPIKIARLSRHPPSRPAFSVG